MLLNYSENFYNYKRALKKGEQIVLIKYRNHPMDVGPKVIYIYIYIWGHPKS